VALQAQIFRSCLCVDAMDVPFAVPSRDDVIGGPILHAQNVCVKVRRVTSDRSVVVPQDEIHDVGLAMEQTEQTHPKHDARVAVPGCTAHSSTHMTSSGGRAPCGSALDSRALVLRPVLRRRHLRFPDWLEQALARGARALLVRRGPFCRPRLPFLSKGPFPRKSEEGITRVSEVRPCSIPREQLCAGRRSVGPWPAPGTSACAQACRGAAWA
jgi:hypothetical protein